MQYDIAFAPPAENLSTDERLAELAVILASAIARTNPRETNENSSLDGDSSLDILALRRRRRRQVQNRVGDDA
ncbi:MULTISPECIES: hypothetical protein [unclassified Paracoccus (in: a-proteobacteria)]|uniref:hypothetical protein n=1 Tax=unclassified Paracoccus (in: a-proteobacteria) TaxID=2688777 RepID=UPI0012B2A026|nr:MULTISPECIES: hypothetical protein [unclassified Paracoccus (in: a-proteobacteria)]UXU74193.1 hypothetical protein GB879_009765 [Paracoccus sp. SMMA_5]UXU80081.1 hypothetical protein GB880_009735 [Paracoccus sp. SMMA_5_TC]